MKHWKYMRKMEEGGFRKKEERKAPAEAQEEIELLEDQVITLTKRVKELEAKLYEQRNQYADKRSVSWLSDITAYYSEPTWGATSAGGLDRTAAQSPSQPRRSSGDDIPF